MRALSAWELLSVWEWGQAQPADQRALALLAAACPDTPPDTLATLSIGERDARLLALREWAFGPRLDCVTTCPECSERLELQFQVADLRASGDMPQMEDDDAEVEAAGPLSLQVGDCEVRFRLPNSLDLSTLAEHGDLVTGRHLLLQRCLLGVTQNGEEADLDQLPDDVIKAVVERMAEADPQADVQLDLTCPVCEHRWQVTFDIVSFFWNELNVWAHRTLRQVHILASAYGWREADILALSPGRRNYYLQMVGGS